MRRLPTPVWILLALVVGFAAGIYYRRVYAPTAEERMKDATHDVQQGFDKARKRLFQ